jgi:hypothetical protein
MSGYRESSFDPYAYEQPGRPLRPFNWVQWCGVALIAGAIAFDLVSLARVLGWIEAPGPKVSFAIAPLVIGVALINSRREPGTQVGSEQLAKNRRVLLITVAILAAVLGAATVIEFTGAN